MPSPLLEGKVALVTGASSGLGEATAIEFARAGAKVVVAARREDKSRAVADKIEAAGGQAFFIRTDVTKSADIEAVVARTLQRFGRLDFAVNNAGIGGPALTPLADLAEADFDAVMSTNLKSVWLSMKYEIPAMLKRPVAHRQWRNVTTLLIASRRPGRTPCRVRRTRRQSENWMSGSRVVEAPIHSLRLGVDGRVR